MKDYASMSNFEINKAVSMALLDKSANPSARYVAIGDYCNNPADAWPIIVGKQISLISRCANGEWKAQLHLGRDDTFDSYASCWDKNPLRAAMIVFLMMKESEND